MTKTQQEQLNDLFEDIVTRIEELERLVKYIETRESLSTDELDDLYVEIPGDTMTGPLIIDGDTDEEQLVVQSLDGQADDNSRFGDVDNGDYSAFEEDGVLRFTGGAKVYDDIQVNVSTARIPAANAPTWRTYNYGIGGGIAYPALGFAVDDYLDFFIQTSHAMELNTAIDNHIHWTIPSDSLGDRIQFQLDVIAAALDVDYAVPAGSPFTNEYTLDGTEAGKHKLLDLADVPASNSTVSTIYICRLTRIAATQDEYGPEVYVTFNDSHYTKDTVGSRTEASK